MLVPICKSLVDTGTPKQAKQAIRCLYKNTTTDAVPLFTEILEVNALLQPLSLNNYVHVSACLLKIYTLNVHSLLTSFVDHFIDQAKQTLESST